MTDTTYVMMFSGGRTSAFLAKYVKENPKYKNVIFVFLNTGKEREETLIFADKCDKEFGLNLLWLEAKITFKIDFSLIPNIEEQDRIITGDSIRIR